MTITQSYYKGQSAKNLIGPGAYNIPRELGSNRFYIGQKLKLPENHNNPTTRINITNECLDKLSTFVKENAAVRLKTEYYPKDKYQAYDNKVPGPGACKKILIQTSEGIGRQLQDLKIL